MEVFNICPGQDVLIYGAGKLGYEIYQSIKNYYNVVAFIDKRKISFKDLSVPVIGLNDLVQYREIPVVICVHNANWHKEIAELLIEKGCYKVLRIASYKEPLCFTKKMNEKYCAFLEKEFDKLTDIPIGYEEVNYVDDNIIRQGKEYTVVWCDFDLLFTGGGTIQEHTKIDFLSNVSVVQLKECFSLFEYFMYGKGSPQSYVSLFRDINDSVVLDEPSFLKEQYMIYLMIKETDERNLQEYAPLEVKWDEKGYFHVFDGCHRWVYYTLKGYNKIPVRMKTEDYVSWKNEKKVRQLYDFFGDEKISIGKSNNPLLSKYNNNPYCSQEFILEIERYIYNKNKGKTVVEIGESRGFYSRLLYHMDYFENFLIFANSKKEEEIIKINNDVSCFTSKYEIIRNFKEINNKDFDLVICSGEYDLSELISSSFNIKTFVFISKEGYLNDLKGFIKKRLISRYINGEVYEVSVLEGV